MSRLPAWIGSIALTTVLALPAMAAGPSDFAGTYALSASASEQAAIDAAIDKAAEGFNAIIRPIARIRLTGAAKLPKRLLITAKGSDIGVQKDSLPMRVTRTDGTPLVFTHSGKTTRMSRQTTGNTLVETAKTDEGVRTLTFRLSDGGKTLVVTSTVESKQLKAPLTLSASYRRTGN